MSSRATKPIKAGIGMPVMLVIFNVSHVRGASSGSRNHCSTVGMFGECTPTRKNGERNKNIFRRTVPKIVVEKEESNIRGGGTIALPWSSGDWHIAQLAERPHAILNPAAAGTHPQVPMPRHVMFRGGLPLHQQPASEPAEMCSSFVTHHRPLAPTSAVRTCSCASSTVQANRLKICLLHCVLHCVGSEVAASRSRCKWWVLLPNTGAQADPQAALTTSRSGVSAHANLHMGGIKLGELACKGYFNQEAVKL